MYKTLEASFLGRDNVVLGLWYYFCEHVVYVVHVAYVSLCSCGVVYT